jgi:DNA-binding CsgD family transcriptional regulator
MMVKSKLSAAEKLLERLAVFSQDYRRNADYIEALTLRAICLWRVKRTAEAIKTMTAAIVKAAQLQLVMPIVKDGSDVLPVLQKILNRLKYGYDADTLDKAFVNALYIKARNISKHTPGMFSRNKAQAMKLSPRQSEVMGYLVQNLSYKEISEKMKVTKAAVEYHIRILHEKFDASNTRELLQKAQDLGFLDLR